MGHEKYTQFINACQKLDVISHILNQILASILQFHGFGV